MQRVAASLKQQDLRIPLQRMSRTLRFEGLEQRAVLAGDLDDSISEAIALGAASATTPATVSDIISPDVDVDMYKFSVTAAQVVDFDIDTVLNGPGGLGSYIRLFNWCDFDEPHFRQREYFAGCRCRYVSVHSHNGASGRFRYRHSPQWSGWIGFFPAVIRFARFTARVQQRRSGSR